MRYVLNSPTTALEVLGPVKNNFWLEDLWFSWIPPFPSLTDQVCCPYHWPCSRWHFLNIFRIVFMLTLNEKSSYLINKCWKTKSKNVYIRISPKLRLPHKKSHLSLSNCNSKFFIVCTCDGSLGGNTIKLNWY